MKFVKFENLLRKGLLLATVLVLSGNFLANASEGDWGQTGHRVTAAIAEQYLTPEAKRNIADLLGDETLVTVSTYADEIKSYSEYRKFSSWHYVNIAPGKTYEEDEKNEGGDLYMAIEHCVQQLKSDTLSKEEKVFSLKMLVHLVGDLHQPLHVGRASDKGGNDIQVRWFDSGTNLHSVWDSKMINSYDMTYTELTQNYGQRDIELYEELSQSGLDSWVSESRGLADEVYASAKVGEKLSYRYLDENWDLVVQQLEKGGIRLAVLLNDIFKES